MRRCASAKEEGLLDEGRSGLQSVCADRIEALLDVFSGCLPLGNAACCLLELLLVFAASSGALRFGRSLLAGDPLYFLAFQLIFNLGGVCHL